MQDSLLDWNMNPCKEAPSFNEVSTAHPRLDKQALSLRILSKYP